MRWAKLNSHAGRLHLLTPSLAKYREGDHIGNETGSLPPAMGWNIGCNSATAFGPVPDNHACCQYCQLVRNQVFVGCIISFMVATAYRVATLAESGKS